MMILLKKNAKKIFVWIPTLLLYTENTASSMDFSLMLEKAAQTSELVKKGLEKERDFRKKTIEQIDELLKEIGKKKQSFLMEDPEKLKEKILCQIGQDCQILTNMNQSVRNLESKKLEFSRQFRTNKLTEVLEGVKPLIEKSFFDLLEGKMPYGYAYDQEKIPFLSTSSSVSPSSVWGNSKGTFLKTALFYIEASMEKDSSHSFGKKGASWFDQSALAHITPISHKEKISVDWSSLSFVYDDSYLIIPHSGYQIWGTKQEERYPDGKLFGPQDCTSWLSELTKATDYTTADLLYAYRYLAKTQAYTPENWSHQTVAQYLTQKMEIVPMKYPLKDIQPGQLFVSRVFDIEKDPEMTQTEGLSGHAGLTIGYEDDHVIVMSYSRLMPVREGFGIQKIYLNHKEPDSSSMNFLLRWNEK